MEQGKYKGFEQRPKTTFKELITEDIVRENLPGLSKEERFLLSMDQMEVTKGQAAQYLVDKKNPTNVGSFSLNRSLPGAN